MATKQEDLWYVEHNKYDSVIKEFNSAIKYDSYDLDHLHKTMLDMKSIQPNLNKNDYIISNLYRLFSSTPPFYSDITTNYCKYINMWLNEKYREKHYYINGPYFDVFKTFIIKLNRVKFGNIQKPCEKYINHLDPDRFNKVKLLYDLYDAYNKINKFYKNKSKDTCGDIVALDKNYRDSIYDYYVNDKILFDKLEHIKELILGIKKNYLSPCTYSLFFSTPQKLIDLREKEAQEAKEEQLRKQNETERREREEQLRNGNAEMEQQPEQPFRVSAEQLPRNNALQGTPLEGEFQSTGDSEDLRTSEVSGLREHTHTSQSLETSRSPTGNLFWRKHIPEGQFKYKKEENELLREEGHAQDNAIRTTGTFFGSSGIQGYITEILGSVEPGPVLGVSGGMGALFLLFKYTPVGSFFGGRRGRFRQIPRTFGGFTPGEFPNFQEYDGGSIGYSPMGISPFAE